MSCPPGTIFNPYSLRCVKAEARRARQLVRAARYPYAQPVPQPQPNPQLFPPNIRRQTQRRRDPADLFGVPRVGAVDRKARLLGRRLFRSPSEGRPPVCGPGEELNPATRRCIKIGGRTFKRLHRAPLPVLKVPRDEVIDIVDTSAVSEGPVRLPVGTAAVAPLGDRAAVLGWAAENCKNAVDPITNTVFMTADTTALQEIIRLHDRTCTIATPLSGQVAADHKAGRITAVPGTTKSLTLDDFRALRDAMRRRDPAYKVPQRKNVPPPDDWQLVFRPAGADFLSVAYVDVTQGIPTPRGVEYPPLAHRANLGYLPVRAPTGAMCSATMLQDLLTRLARSNRLLVAVAGGWKPPAGFPFSKAHWQHPQAAERYTRLCKDLAKLLGTPPE